MKPEIESGSLTVFILDECHLLWGDSLGYIWGKRNSQVEVPISNQKQRQTYYGAVNKSTGNWFGTAYPCGNGLHTVSFVQELYQTQKSKLLLIWDGASYHKCSKMQEYLAQINNDLDEEDWQISCVLLAPNAPEQNPVEDIWFYG